MVQLNGRQIRQRRLSSTDTKPFHTKPPHLRLTFGGRLRTPHMVRRSGPCRRLYCLCPLLHLDQPAGCEECSKRRHRLGMRLPRTLLGRGLVTVAHGGLLQTRPESGHTDDWGAHGRKAGSCTPRGRPPTTPDRHDGSSAVRRRRGKIQGLPR